MKDEAACAIAGNNVRLDVYGEVFDQRCVTMLTRNGALQLARQLAKLALQLKPEAVTIVIPVKTPKVVVKLPR